MLKECSLDGCGKRAKARGFCQTHYSCWRRHSQHIIDATFPPQNDFEFLSDGTVKIFLTQGEHTIIDIEDFETVIPFRWHAGKYNCTTYAMRCIGRHKNEGMHVLLNATPSGLDTDHIDRDGRNNRRNNLRTATRAQNCQNRMRVKSLSGVTGVFQVGARRWQATIYANGQQIYLGSYPSKEQATQARLAGEKTYFGEFAPQ